MNGQVGNFFRSYLTGAGGVVFNGLYQFDDSGYIESITMSRPGGGADENVTHHLCGCNVEFRSSVTFPLESIAELTRVAAEPGGDNCEAGGVAIHTGRDLNGNRALEDSEIETTTSL